MTLQAKSEQQVRREILDRLAPKCRALHANKDGIVVSDAMRRFNDMVEKADLLLGYDRQRVGAQYVDLYHSGKSATAEALKAAAQAVGMWKE